MRFDTEDHLDKIFKQTNIKVQIINTQEETLKKLKGITDPERNVKQSGNYILMFLKGK